MRGWSIKPSRSAKSLLQCGLVRLGGVARSVSLLPPLAFLHCLADPAVLLDRCFGVRVHHSPVSCSQPGATDIVNVGILLAPARTSGLLWCFEPSQPLGIISGLKELVSQLVGVLSPVNH